MHLGFAGGQRGVLRHLVELGRLGRATVLRGERGDGLLEPAGDGPPAAGHGVTQLRWYAHHLPGLAVRSDLERDAQLLGEVGLHGALRDC
jgi:hypothetical protein